MSVADSPWCAEYSRQAGESPLGTAVAAQRFVLVQLPLPWPAEIADHPLLEPIRAVIDDRTAARLLALGCEERCDEEHTVLCYWRDPAQPFAGFRSCEQRLPRAAMTSAVATWLRGDELTSDGAARRRDLLICTHGGRDRCCGKHGGRLFEDLRQRGGGPRLWRTSHTGGHRFAPTAMTFPEGLAWAWLDADTLAAIADRTLPAQRILQHLRGCAGFDGGPQQAADAVALTRRGWGWLETPRTVEAISDDGKAVDLRVNTTATADAFNVRIARGRTLPIAPCGEPLANAAKSTTELLVRSQTQ